VELAAACSWSSGWIPADFIASRKLLSKLSACRTTANFNHDNPMRATVITLNARPAILRGTLILQKYDQLFLESPRGCEKIS